MKPITKSRNKREGGYAGKSRWARPIVPHKARHFRSGTRKFAARSLRDWSRA